jgi:hypothetical protein
LCRWSQTSAPCQLRRRRQQIMPLPQPILRGSVPAQASLQDEQDAREQCTIIEGLAPRITVSPWFWRGNRGSMSDRSSSLSIGFSPVLFVVEAMKRSPGFIESKQPPFALLV